MQTDGAIGIDGNKRTSLTFCFSPIFRFRPAPLGPLGLRFNTLTPKPSVENVPSKIFPLGPWRNTFKSI